MVQLLARRFLLAAATLALAAASVRAQATGPASAAAKPDACSDEALTLFSRHVTDTLYLRLPGSDSSTGRTRVLRATLLQAVAEQFRMPRVVAGTFVERLAVADLEGPPGIFITAEFGRPRFGSEVAVELRKRGRAKSVTLSRRGDVVALDAALFAAVQAADSAGAFTDPADEVYRAARVLRVALDRRPRRVAEAVPLAVIAYDVLVATQPVSPDPGTPAPKYPEVARRAGAGDEVEMSFIVATDGRVEPSSLRVERATYREFVESVTRFLITTARYRPALVGACPVRQLVKQRFAYEVR